MALLNGIPLSASEDGAIKLWDVTAGTPIVSLDAHHGVHAMRVNASSGQLVSCGWGLHVWDVAAAQMVSTLSGADDAVVPRPYTCVALFGNLVAAGRAGEVALFDVRSSQGAVGRLAWGYDSSSDSSSSSGLTGLSSNAPAIATKSMVPALGSIAAAAGAGVGVVLAPFGGSISIAGAAGAPGCVGVALDDWKLITGFAGGRHTLTLHDIRTMTASTSTVLNTAAAAASNGSSNAMRPGSSTGGAEVVTSWPEPHAVIDGSARDTSSSGSSSASADLQGWQRPLLTLHAPARIIGFAMHDQRVLAGLEGAECILWRMDAPRGSAAAALAEATAAAALPAAGSTSCAGGGLGAKEKAGKDKGGKVRKLKTRFPKRGTK